VGSSKARNLKKHGVTFGEALAVFIDPQARSFDDPDHSADEPREIIVGYSSRSRLLVVGLLNEPAGPGSLRRAARRELKRDAMKRTRKAANAGSELRARRWCSNLMWHVCLAHPLTSIVCYGR
jgi:uncharacterized protein